MSFITDIVKFGLGQFGIEATGDTPSAIAKSAITSFLTQKVNNAIKKSNTPSSGATTSNIIERNVSLEIKADTTANIPVVYGEGFVTPLLVDAQQTNNNCTMWYAVALCEVTGNDLNGNASNITFEEIYWDNKKLTFGFDGVTVVGAWEGVGANAKNDTSLSNNVKIYCYNNGSNNPTNVRPQGLAVQHPSADKVMPLWTANHSMSNLVFALIRVDYDAENNVRNIGNLKFKLRNSMKLPGDVINDYLTNTVYGAGIANNNFESNAGTLLNNYSSGSVDFTDNRPNNVIFTIPITETQTATITSATSTITRPYDIEEIINSSIEYSIDISNLPGASINWGSLPAGITDSESNQVYTLDGITTITQWDTVKDATIQLPTDLHGNFTYTVTLTYDDYVTTRTYSWIVNVFVPVCALQTTSALSAAATIIEG